MADNTVLVAAISVVGGGGLAGALVALIKVRPESGQILVKTAQDVVLIQQGAMTDMQQRLSAVEAERDRLRHRVTELETSVATLQRRVGEAGPT